MSVVCPSCRRRYDNDRLKFCVEDGVELVPIAEEQSVESVVETAPAPAHQMALITDAAFPPRVDPLAEGAVVGEYLVGRKIGEGGMGVIYSGVHPIIGKKIALKVLNRELAGNPDMVQRFILEARAVNQIGHRNIVDIFSFGRLSDGRNYFAMEFLEGKSLAARLADDRALPWADAVQIWIQVASAIEAAHAHGIVHRDLKPDNVFVTPGGDGPFVKVLDFGIAKLLGDASPGQRKTSTGAPIGTPAYMSPEQVRGEGVDHRTDIYAFGIILYETISLRPPFGHHRSFVALLSAHLSEPPPPLATLADVHPELARLVELCLAKSPDDRPPTMKWVRDELLRLRDLAGALSHPLFAPKGDMAGLHRTIDDSPTRGRPVAAGDAPGDASATAAGEGLGASASTTAVDEDASTRQRLAVAPGDAARGPAASPALPSLGPSAPAAASASSVAPSRSADTPPPSLVPSVPSGRWVPIAGAAVLVAVVAGGLAYRASRVQPPDPVPAPAPPSPVVVTPPPRPDSPPTTSALPPGTGRVLLTTNANGTRVFLDRNEHEPATEPAAAGGMNLKVLVPADTPWSLRIEAEGYRPATMQLKLAAGEEMALPVVLIPVEPERLRRGTPTPRPTPPPPPAPGTKQKRTVNPSIIDPFAGEN